MATDNQTNETLLAAIEQNPAAAQAIAALAGGASAAEVIASLIEHENAQSQAKVVPPPIETAEAPSSEAEENDDTSEISVDEQASDAAPEAQQPDVLPVAAGDGVPVASPSFLSEISCDFWENF